MKKRQREVRLMRVHSDLSEMPYMKAFPGSG